MTNEQLREVILQKIQNSPQAPLAARMDPRLILTSIGFDNIKECLGDSIKEYDWFTNGVTHRLLKFETYNTKADINLLYIKYLKMKKQNPNTTLVYRTCQHVTDMQTMNTSLLLYATII